MWRSLQILKAMALDELDIPKLFVVVPADNKLLNGMKFNPSALYNDKVKLIFLCEHTFHPLGDGFIVDRPKVIQLALSRCIHHVDKLLCVYIYIYGNALDAAITDGIALVVPHVAWAWGDADNACCAFVHFTMIGVYEAVGACYSN
jgi:hypothetical protein